jgi:hypothetical protein
MRSHLQVEVSAGGYAFQDALDLATMSSASPSTEVVFQDHLTDPFRQDVHHKIPPRSSQVSAEYMNVPSARRVLSPDIEGIARVSTSMPLAQHRCAESGDVRMQKTVVDS